MFAPTGTIDQALGVFNSKANGERLGQHGHIQIVELGKGVSGTVSKCQDQVVARQGVGALCVFIKDQGLLELPGRASPSGTGLQYFEWLKPQVHQLLTKPDFSTQGNDLLA